MKEVKCKSKWAPILDSGLSHGAVAWWIGMLSCEFSAIQIVISVYGLCNADSDKVETE